MLVLTLARKRSCRPFFSCINTSLYYSPQAAEASVPSQPAICPLKMIRIHKQGHDLGVLRGYYVCVSTVFQPYWSATSAPVVVKTNLCKV